MGRGLSEQQRQILGLARAFNATENGGAPVMATFDFHVHRGDLFDGGKKRAYAELAWRPSCPDYHEGFGLWVLCGFRSTWGAYNDKWHPATVCRKRRVSMSRAVDSLVRRGMLCHAMDPAFALHWFTDGTELKGYGKTGLFMGHRSFDWRSVAETAPETLQRFWRHSHDAVPSYWLTEAGHEAAGDLWRRWDVEQLVDDYHESREPFRYGCRIATEWWEHATAEAAEESAKELAQVEARLSALAG